MADPRLQQVINLLSKMSAGGPTRRQRGRRTSAQQVPLASASTTAATPPRFGGRGRRGRGQGRGRGGLMANPNSGDVMITKTEIVKGVTIVKNASTAVGSIDLAPDSFPWLQGVFKAFERVSWKQVTVWWVTKVPATEGGTIGIGIDWDGKGEATTLTALSGYSPNKSCPVYAGSQACNLKLPANRLHGRAWYVPLDSDWANKMPAVIRFVVEASKAATVDTNYGYIYCSYKVILSGTRA